MKMKRTLSLILILAMLIPLLLPSGGVSIVANAVEANEIETYVSTQKGFTIDQYETLKGYYDTCVANGWNESNGVPSFARLQAAVEQLAAGADFYDDFQVLGEYVGASETIENIGTVGIEPANPGDVFPTATNTSNYEVIWSGVVAQRYTEETVPAELANGRHKQTYPYVLDFSKNNVGTHHVLYYWFDGCEYNRNYLHGENQNYCKTDTYEGMGLYNNWMTLKDSVIGEAEGLPVFSVTTKTKANFPRIVYNWIDVDNYNYIETAGGYQELYAIEVKEGVKTRTRIGANGQGLADAIGWSASTPIEYKFVWNPSKGGYTLSIINTTDVSRFYSIDLTTSLPVAMVDNVRFSIRPDQGAAKNNIFASLKAVSFSSSIAAYVDNRIKNEVPEIADVERTDLAMLEALLAEINAFGEEIVSQVTNMKKLTDAIAEAKRLQGEYDTQFSINDCLTFEDGNALAWKDYFATPGQVEIIDNPAKDAVNSSDKVLYVRRNNSINLIDSLATNVYSITGKAHESIGVGVYDGSSYAGYSLSLSQQVIDGQGNPIDTLGITPSANKNGSAVNVGDTYVDRAGLPEGVTFTCKWFDFAVRIKSGVLSVEIGAWASDGKYYTHNQQITFSNMTEGDSVLRITGSTWYSYVDDLKVTSADEDAYFEADSFVTSHAYILGLKYYDQFLSGEDETEYNALIADYETLTPLGKLAIGQVTLNKVEEAKKAWANVSTASAEADALIRGYALDNFQMSGSNYARRYRLFTSADNDDFITQWQVASSAGGRADVITDAELGRNVIRLRANTVLTLKEKFMPEKANLSEMSYYVEPVGNDLAAIYHYSDTRTRVAEPYIPIYSYYKDAKNYQRCALYSSQLMWETVTNGVSVRQRALVYTDLGDGKFNPALGIKVEIRYVNGKAQMTMTDAAGSLIEQEVGYVVEAKNIPAIGCLAMTGYRLYNNVDVHFDYRDITLKFAKGDWDDDVVQSKLNVSYNGNTYQSPGDVAVIRGENLGALLSGAKIIQVTNQSNPALGYIDRTAYDYAGVEDGEFTLKPTTAKVDWSQAIDLDFVHKSTDSVQFIIPEDFTHGIYAVQLRAVINRVVHTKVVYLNAPVIDFYLGSDGEMASPGTKLELVGENLSPNQNANKDAAAYELRIKDREIDDVKVKLISRADPTVKYDLTIKEITSDYNIVVEIPQEIEVAADGSTTEWEVYVYNGYGDDTCWSIPKVIKIGRPLAELRPTNWVDIRDYMGTNSPVYTMDATASMQKALADLAKMGGGTLYMPEGSYRIGYTIYVPENVTIQGDGPALTNILPTFINFGYDNLPDRSGLVLANNCTIDGVAFYVKRARRVISAPSLLKNVTINDVKFYHYYTSWANNSLGQGGNLVDRFDLYKYNESQNEANAWIYGSYENFKLTNIQATVNEGGLSLMNSYSSNCNYGKFENVDFDVGIHGKWLRALFNNAVWKNCTLAGGNANQARGVYMYNIDFGPQPSYNREIWVADLAGNPGISYGLYTDEAAGITAENSVYLKPVGVVDIRTYEWLASGHYQLYFISGNGAGQTAEIVGLDYEKNCLVIAEPFQVPINRNTKVTTRPPREDIYFVDCSFFEGGCPGGFFGGCADVVHDGDYMNYAFNQYYDARTYDVNWYCSMVNSVWENTPYALIAAYGMSKGRSYCFQDDNSNMDNSQLGILIRNNRIDNLALNNDARQSGKQKDFIIDNNVFDGLKYILGGGKPSIPDGLTFYRNRGDELTAYVGGSINTNGTNKLGYSYVVYLDEDGAEQSALLGDVNMDGVISLKDVSTIHYAVIGEIALTELQIKLGDVNGDGKITAVDATYIRSYLLDSIDEFPAEQEPEPPTDPDPTDPDPTDPDPTDPESTDPEPPTTEPGLEATEGEDVDDEIYSPGYH